jgi:hypothetical protein
MGATRRPGSSACLPQRTRHGPSVSGQNGAASETVAFAEFVLLHEILMEHSVMARILMVSLKMGRKDRKGSGGRAMKDQAEDNRCVHCRSAGGLLEGGCGVEFPSTGDSGGGRTGSSSGSPSTAMTRNGPSSRLRPQYSGTFLTRAGRRRPIRTAAMACPGARVGHRKGPQSGALNLALPFVPEPACRVGPGTSSP